MKTGRIGKVLGSITIILLFIPFFSWASGGTDPDMTRTTWGWAAVIIFVFAYLLVIFEEKIHLKKSKPVLIAAGVIWIFIAIVFDDHVGEESFRHHLLDYAELFLFLLVAMTYINSLENRNVFLAIKAWLVRKKFSLRMIFWITGLISFFMSPIADNLTTALLMGTVITAVGKGNKRFLVPAYINIVVAANAGGAFSPFGDITTLMVWQKGKIQFFEFFPLFIPSVVNWLVPALIISFIISKEKPDTTEETIRLKYGAWIMIVLFCMTIVTAVFFHTFLHLPPVAGMMLGLGYLGILAFFIKEHDGKQNKQDYILGIRSESTKKPHFDIMTNVARSEWDTLLFFYGVIMCVGGLAQFGYLSIISNYMYMDLGATTANILVGILSAILDNIPVMFAVLNMNPVMDHSQWLLVTLTAGVGGSLLSIGSAAGVALMGASKGVYTFWGHLKWAPIIALGYALSIYCHYLINM